MSQWLRIIPTSQTSVVMMRSNSCICSSVILIYLYWISSLILFQSSELSISSYCSSRMLPFFTANRLIHLLIPYLYHLWKQGTAQTSVERNWQTPVIENFLFTSTLWSHLLVCHSSVQRPTGIPSWKHHSDSSRTIMVTVNSTLNYSFYQNELMEISRLPAAGLPGPPPKPCSTYLHFRTFF